MERISSTIQLADTGIVPGAGVDNARKELTVNTLGVPVIALGIPTVVETAVVVNDCLDVFIEKLQEKGSNLVFVLGHKEYYPKYGFIPDANHLGYPAPYPILEEYSDYWMVQPISPKGFEIGKGKIKCSEELNKPEHWRNEESDR